MHAYSQSYLSDARENMAEMTWFVDRHTTLELDAFWLLFIASGLAREFAHGSPRALAGRSGVELAAEVFDRMGIAYDPEEVRLRVREDESCAFGRTPAYWCGWVLAFYQWHSGLSFRRIHAEASFEWLLRAYPTLHETSELHVAQVLDERLGAQGRQRALKQLRLASGLSQSQLARAAGVGIRAIQQYEQGSKDINKAAVSTVVALARTLHCEVEELLEPVPSCSYELVELP